MISLSGWRESSNQTEAALNYFVSVFCVWVMHWCVCVRVWECVCVCGQFYECVWAFVVHAPHYHSHFGSFYQIAAGGGTCRASGECWESAWKIAGLDARNVREKSVRNSQRISASFVLQDLSRGSVHKQIHCCGDSSTNERGPWYHGPPLRRSGSVLSRRRNVTTGSTALVCPNPALKNALRAGF